MVLLGVQNIQLYVLNCKNSGGTDGRGRGQFWDSTMVVWLDGLTNAASEVSDATERDSNRPPVE